jgi:hypothetical protein
MSVPVTRLSVEEFNILHDTRHIYTYYNWSEFLTD